MSKSSDRASKLGSLDVGAITAAPTEILLQEPARTAPGQLMMYQGDLKKARDKSDELQKQLDAAGAREIALSDIYLVPSRKRQLTSSQRQELKDNLSQNPLLHPVTVLPKSERGYELVSGYNRIDIYRELGRTHIEAFVKELDPGKVETFAFYANLLSPSLPDFEKYQGFKKRQIETSFTQVQLAEESGVSQPFVSSLFVFDSLPDEAKAILNQAPDILGWNAAKRFVKAVEEGKSDRVIEALKRLATYEKKFTQAKAIAFIYADSRPQTKRSEPRLVRNGSKRFCKMETRENVVAIQFTDSSVANEWLAKFEEFVKAQIESDDNP